MVEEYRAGSVVILREVWDLKPSRCLSVSDTRVLCSTLLTLHCSGKAFMGMAAHLRRK